MVNLHTTDPFAPAILGLAILVGSPALALLLPAETVATLTATPLRRAVSATLLLVLISGLTLWAVSRASLRAASAVEGERTQGGQN